MLTAEENFLLLQRIDTDRQFLLLALQSNPQLLESADPEVKALFSAVPPAPTFPQSDLKP